MPSLISRVPRVVEVYAKHATVSEHREAEQCSGTELHQLPFLRVPAYELYYNIPQKPHLHLF